MKTMKAVVLEDFKSPLVIKEIDIPQLKSGQVLIKVEAAPINPADNAFLKGKYPTKRKDPVVPGIEGCGRVIQSGGGLMGWSLVGKKVAFVSHNALPGTWAEYCVTNALSCITLDDKISSVEGCLAMVNPATTYLAYQKIVKKDGHKGVITTAGASAMGKMVYRYFQETNKIPAVSVVRREEQVEMLKKEGFENVLNSNDENFEERVKELCKKFNITALFDCVAGEVCGKILKNMPKKSIAYVYGSLSLKNCVIDPMDFIANDKQLTGIYAGDLLAESSMFRKIRMSSAVQSLIGTSFKTTVNKSFPLEEINEAVAFYKKNMTAGKIIIEPSLNSGSLQQKEAKKEEKEEIQEKKEEIQEKNDEIQEKKEEAKLEEDQEQN